MWQGDRKTIVLSGRLVREFPWVSVREVLLHETAHQVADESLGGDDTPHGPRFHEACRLLRADPRASGDVASIHQRLEGDSDRDGDRILSRVRKLLALGHGEGCHEAELAMAKVHAYMAKHNVSLLECGAKPDFLSMSIGAPVSRFAAEDYAMMGLLREFYFVSTVVIPAYVVSKGRMGRVIEASGRAENLKMAGYVYEFLKRTVDEQWTAFGSRVAGGRRHRKTDFAVGLVRGFREKLESQKVTARNAASATQALVAKGDREAAAYLKARYPHLRSISRRGRRVDAEVVAAGAEVGRRTVLSKPIEGKRAGRGLRLAP
jgi:hypothetical protein